jgi:hypothetical protein
MLRRQGGRDDGKSHTRPRSGPARRAASVRSEPARAILARLTARMIERLDEMDGDPDDEPEEDCCDAGDDVVRSGVSPAYRWCQDVQRAGSDDDAEPWRSAAFDRDESPRPPVNYNRPKRWRKPAAPMLGNVGELIPIGRWRQVIG